MCLISYCPPGTEKYNEAVENFVRAGFATNWDGSGIMWKKANDKKVYVKKGFFNVDELLKYIKNLNLKLEDELGIHHRIGTQGENNAVNTHPFYCSKDHETCIALEGALEVPALMHNGIFQNTTAYDKVGFSDTYSVANGILSNKVVRSLIKYSQFRFESAFSDVISSGKMLIMSPDDETVIIGSFITDDGYKHSNNCYYDWGYRDRGGRAGKKASATTTYHSTTQVTGTSNSQRSCGLIFDTRKPVESYPSDTKKSLKFDDTNMALSQDNYKDFIFVLKPGITINPNIRPTMAYKGSLWTADTNLVGLYLINDDKSVYTISAAVLKTCFYYYPMMINKVIYTDYEYMLRKLQPTKSLLKNLRKQLGSKHNQLPSTRFIVKKLGVPMSKRGVELYFNRFKDDFLDKPQKKGLFRTKVSDLVH